jgi:hypothetical protein
MKQFITIILITCATTLFAQAYQNLAVDRNNSVNVTFTTSDNFIYAVGIQGYGNVGYVSKELSLTLSVDRNRTYPLQVNEHRKTIFGKAGFMKSSRWTSFSSPKNDVIIDFARDRY